jgi:CheY-like chemotaxis protein
VVDGDQVAYDVLNRALSDRGYRVEWVATGGNALIAAKEHQPDVIVLDMVMPELDGWTALTALKQDPETESIPVILVTLSHEAELGVSMGAVDYLIKPVQPPKLVAAVQRWLGQSTANVGLLVVEDDDDLREIMQRTLSGAGYDVQLATNGLEALQRVKEAHPDLVLLDLMMPEMDGFEFLHHLRNDPKYSQLPVIVSTAKELTDEERALLHTSAQKVIQKVAHSRAELLHFVEKQVGELLASSANSTRPPGPA